MKITPTLQPLLDAARREVPSLLQQLKIGQVVPAKVLSHVQPGLLRLQIATTQLLARSPVMPAPGSQLQLQVIKGLPRPELRLLQQAAAPDPLQQVVRSAILRQLPPSEQRQQLNLLRSALPPAGAPPAAEAAQGPGLVRAGGPAPAPALLEAVRQLVRINQESGLAMNRLNPAEVQRAITQSGIFHEARMAGQGSAEAADLKVRLLQMLSLLSTLKMPAGEIIGTRDPRVAPPAAEPGTQNQASGPDTLFNRLIRLIEGSVSRIQLQQSTALPVEEGQRQAWQIDLPIRLPGETHDLLLRIERDDSTDGSAGQGPGWAVNLAFEFDSTGPLQCRIALNGERLATTFWSERNTTHQRIEQRLPKLRDAFEAQGFAVVHLSGVLGKPPEPLIHVPRPDKLFDDHA